MLRQRRFLLASLTVYLVSGGASLIAQNVGGAVTAQRTEPPRAPALVFGSDAALVLNFIKPDKTADFELIVAKLKEALHKSDRPERQQQALGWRVFKANEPGPSGSVIYLFWIDQPLKGADYTISTVLAQAFPSEAQTLTAQLADSLAQPQVSINLMLSAALRK
jgi:hypothetical protein